MGGGGGAGCRSCLPSAAGTRARAASETSGVSIRTSASGPAYSGSMLSRRSRAAAPAIPAEDAILLDNSGITLEETIEAAIAIIDGKMNA